MMAASGDAWELSKENIQPLQQGRKQDALKVGLSTQQQDHIAQQKQAFEDELRTYTGDDPLGIWYKYIKWVEQVFPKGGRDGHLHKLIRQCLSHLYNKTQYHNDKRLIEIWLKYATCSLKAVEVFENMYSHNIGCKNASFFMAWSWELEQQGNVKKANDIIDDGIQRLAEPVEKLKAYRAEFEIRVAKKVWSNKEMNDLEENSRSVFSVLKPQKKKNTAPVSRVAASMMEHNHQTSLVHGRQQAMPKSSVQSSKVPFKIYNAENLPPPLPLQTENHRPFTLFDDGSKENEKKPSKWNKVKLKQAPSSVAEANPGFKFHCDEDMQPASTPRSVSKVSNVLKETKTFYSPEKQNPKELPMYDKAKVYCGGEEFSLEEIKAAAWFKAHKERKLAEQEMQLKEQQSLINSLQLKLQLLEKEVNKPNSAVHPDSNLTQTIKTLQIDSPPSNLKRLSEMDTKSSGHHSEFSDFKNLFSENEDVENIPPKDYPKIEIKRELAGILQLSKTVPFIPLKEQSEEDSENEEDEAKDIVFKENNNHPLQDETLIPPCNTEQFVCAAFLASTPRSQVKAANCSDLHSSYKEELPHCTEKWNGVTGNEAICQALPDEITFDIKPAYKPEPKLSTRDQSARLGLQGQLSVILETSRECYKSSSSSGSSGSATRWSQFSQCYSHEKSNIQKHLSKTEVFKEPRPISHSKEVADIQRDCSPLRNNKVTCPSTVEAKSFEVYCSDIDPFAETERNNFLASICKSNDIFESITVPSKLRRILKANDCIELGGNTYLVKNLVAEGAFGKVYEAEKKHLSEQSFDSAHSNVALKVSKVSGDWEYYICTTLHNRLAESTGYPDIQSSVMEILSACKYSDCAILMSEFNRQGTLLDLVNLHKKDNSSMPEIFACYLTLELLQIVGKIHECNIIHTDIKPENILVRDLWNFDILKFLGQKTTLLQFIDFGRAIDLKAFKSGICFKTTVKENCIEMREKKPWVFQLDWYGVLNCIHIILFSEYMKVKQNKNGRWEIEKKIKRYWDQALWLPLFDELLNIPTCYQQPDLNKFTNMIILKLRKSETPFMTYFRRLANVYNH